MEYKGNVPKRLKGNVGLMWLGVGSFLNVRP